MNQEETKLNRAAELLKLVANSSRMKIITILAQQGQLNVSAIQAQVQTEQSLVSHSLIKMKDKGILSSQRKSKEVYYSLIDPDIAHVITLLLNR